MNPYRRLKRGVKRTLSGWELRFVLFNQKGKFELHPTKIPDAHPRPLKMRAACILDDFSYHQLQHEIDLRPVRPDRWWEPFMTGVDLFLVESFWHGSGGSWGSVAYDYHPKERELLRKIVRWCKNNGIPTVFWNKEDPAHFEEFVKIAVEFDHIFTTDANCVDKYRALGKKADVMLFAAQPRLHNPIEKFEKRKDGICFAGSWTPYYPERNRDFGNMIDALSVFGVDIYDRNLGTRDRRYIFPKRFNEMIIGSLKGDDILNAYKGYRFGLNVNSVKDSPTMLARRVFELMACNTPVISNDSMALELIFGDLVISSDDADALQREVERVCTDEWEYRSLRQRALREVMLNHTYGHRTDQIHAAIFGGPPRDRSRKVLCISIEERGPSVSMDFDAQSHLNKELICGKDLESLVSGIWERANSENALLAYMCPGNHYGRHYLSDMANAFMYSDATMVTKVSHFDFRGMLVDDGKQFRWVSGVNPDALMIDPNNVEREEAVDLWMARKVHTEGKCLSIDEFNFALGCPSEGTLRVVDI